MNSNSTVFFRRKATLVFTWSVYDTSMNGIRKVPITHDTEILVRLYLHSLDNYLVKSYKKSQNPNIFPPSILLYMAVDRRLVEFTVFSFPPVFMSTSLLHVHGSNIEYVLRKDLIMRDTSLLVCLAIDLVW